MAYIIIKIKTIINNCPIKPPSIVAIQSNQSQPPACNLSLNSIPDANPNTQRIVNKNPIGIAYKKCFNLLLSNNHITN